MVDVIQIAENLKELGVTPGRSGYYYLKQAILRMLNDQSYITSFCSIYNDIALDVGTSASVIERAMRTAIESAWKNGNIDFQRKLFGYSVDIERCRPTNKEFVMTLVDYYNMQEDSRRIQHELHNTL